MQKPNLMTLGYVLITLGALDLLVYVINDFAFGWLDLVVGTNVVSQYGAWAMMASGFHYTRKPAENGQKASNEENNGESNAEDIVEQVTDF
jgi:hypothetical protein